MEPNARILLVDDDVVVRSSVRLALQSTGYRVLEAGDGEEGLKLAQAEKPALMIVDVRMPKLDGFSTVSELRRIGITCPILMLTSQSQVPDRVTGLEAGADDYLAKPFDRRELLARVNARVRREQRAAVTRRVLRFDQIEVNLETQTARSAGEPLKLTKTEFAILKVLAKTPGTPVSRDQLLDSVWGYTYFPSTRTVDTHVWRLRRKIGDSGETPRWIKRSHGEGYLLECSSAE